MATGSVDSKLLPGVLKASFSRSFCVHPDGSLAILYDYKKKSFVLVDLETGCRSRIKLNLPKAMRSTMTLDLVAITRSSKLFILGLTCAITDTGILSSFIKRKHQPPIVLSFFNNCGSISLIDEHNTSIIIPENSSTILAYPYWHKDEHGRCFVVSCYRDKSATVFNVLLINIDDIGKITTQSILKMESLLGEWLFPFIHTSSFYFIPNRIFDRTILLKVSFLKDSVPVAIKNDFEVWLYIYFQNNRPRVVGNDIFYYACNKHEKDGFLLNLDMNELCWQKISIDLGDHVISQQDATLDCDEKGCLYLHGRCTLDSCNEKAHIIKMAGTKLLDLPTGSVRSTSSLLSLPSVLSPSLYPQARMNEYFPDNKITTVAQVDSESLNEYAELDYRNIAALMDSNKNSPDKTEVFYKNLSRLAPIEPAFLDDVMSARSTVAPEISRLSGVKNVWQNFCVRPEGSIAYHFDFARNSFVEMDLIAGQSTAIETELSGTFDWSINSMRDMIAVTRASMLFILSLVRHTETGKLFVASFFFNSETKSMSVADIQHIETDADIDDSSLYFHKDEIGQVYAFYHCVITRLNLTWTIFYASHITVDEYGKITFNNIFSKRTLKGNWYSPFMHSRSLYFFPHASEGKAQLLQVSLVDKRPDEVIIDIDTDNFRDTQDHYSWISRPQVFSDNIFYYATVLLEQRKIGLFIHLDWKKQFLRKIFIDFCDHQIECNTSKLVLSMNGFLYLHGDCSHDSCQEKAHIYEFKPVLYQALPFSNERPKLQDLSYHPKSVESETTDEVLTKQNQTEQHTTDESTVIRYIFNSESSTVETYVEPKYFQLSLHLTSRSANQANEDESNHLKCALETNEMDTILGEGNFSIVYRCWNPKRQCYFVKKKAKLKSKSEVISRNEVKRLKDLRHPKIIEYYGFENEGGEIVIYMEYMPLGSIKALIRKDGAVAEAKCIMYIEQILDGLVYLHSKGIVHNDLKCDNVLSDHSGNIKISDFGLSVQKYLTAENKSQTNTESEIYGGGTAFWTAPEFFESEAVSRRSDIWSLGCTIVEMLTTKPPYASTIENKHQLIIARAKNELSYNPKELVPTASESMQNFIGCLLKISPWCRPHDAAKATEIFCATFNNSFRSPSHSGTD